MQEGIWLVGLDEVVLYINEHGAQQVGRPVADIVGRRLGEIFGRDQIVGLGDRIRARQNGKVDQYEFSFRTPEGESRCWLVTGSGLTDENGVFVGSLTSTVDFTERKRLEDELWRQSLFDTLTGLPNRALYEDRLGQAALQTEPDLLSLLCIDVDNLRVVNASAGHATGDEVLRVVAGRLHAAAGPTHTVARIDGDQFAVLCPATDVAAAQVLASAVLESLSLPITIEDRTLFLTATIGVANSGDTEPSRLLPSAHAAMFRGKTRGRGRIEVHEAEHAPAASDELQLITDLHWALRREELELFYQPVIDLESGTCQQVEALLRWRHPTRGAVPPSEFIPLAESSGLIDDLGDWVLRRACADAASWTHGSAGPLDVAVNVSPLQLRNGDLVQTITDTLRRSQLEPERLIIEITESAVLDPGSRSPSTDSAGSGCGWRWTTSVPAMPRWPTSRGWGWIRSRSINPSSGISRPALPTPPS